MSRHGRGEHTQRSARLRADPHRELRVTARERAAVPALAAEHRAAMELQYAPARATGNPNVVRRGDTPVMVGEAEMFGSFTAVRDVEADGRGVYETGRWRVVLGAAVGVVNGPLSPGESQVAFALWEGAAKNVGGRKMRSEAWVRLVVV